MIRKFKPDQDMEKVMEIWLTVNLSAHSFIEADYWRSNFETVKSMLPQANVYVYENEDTCGIEGFVGISGDYIAGIFVHEAAQSRGIGRDLIRFARRGKERLTLHVYQKNKRAVKFYEKAGFEIQAESTDENTGEKEYLMKWLR